MTENLGQWRATYTPGDWVVLSGPTSVVVLQPASPEWSTLINTIWEKVLASSSMSELAAVLATHQIEEMPSFGAFFWTGDQMRSLVRGDVRVVDTATGKTVADGDGIQTWTEVGLAGVDQVRIDLQELTGATQLQLPLVVGAVTASSLVLDASAEVRVSSPQGAGTEEVEAEAEVEAEVEAEANWEQPLATEPTEYPRRPLLPDSAPSEVLAAVPPEPTVGLPEFGEFGQFDRPDYDVPFYQGPPQQQAEEEEVEEEEDNADTAMMGITGPPPEPERTVVAVLRATSGETADLDRAVLIGRSPSGDRSTTDPSPRLMAVPSPGHDISRTHLQIEPQGWQVEVTDLHSTNGTLLVLPGSDMGPQRLDPGEPVTVPIGCRLELGDGVSILVEQPV